MCIGYAKRKMASKLIRYTLKRAEANGINRKYLFIAISYLNGAVEVDRELRIEIEEEVSKLIPPKLCECQNLAEAGDLAVQYLKCEKEYDHEERLACLRVLRVSKEVIATALMNTETDTTGNKFLAEIGLSNNTDIENLPYEIGRAHV